MPVHAILVPFVANIQLFVVVRFDDQSGQFGTCGSLWTNVSGRVVVQVVRTWNITIDLARLFSFRSLTSIVFFWVRLLCSTSANVALKFVMHLITCKQPLYYCNFWYLIGWLSLLEAWWPTWGCEDCHITIENATRVCIVNVLVRWNASSTPVVVVCCVLH